MGEAALRVLNSSVPPGWLCTGGLATPGRRRVPSTCGRVPLPCQRASWILSGAGARTSLHLLGRASGMLQEHGASCSCSCSLVALGCPLLAPCTSGHHGRFGAWSVHPLTVGFRAGGIARHPVPRSRAARWWDEAFPRHPSPHCGGAGGCGCRWGEGLGLEGVKAGEGKQECCRAWVADKPNNCF